MALIDLSKREVHCKIVYYGPGRCGKTTNLLYIYNSMNSNAKGKMLTIETKGDRTLLRERPQPVLWSVPAALGKWIRSPFSPRQLPTGLPRTAANARNSVGRRGIPWSLTTVSPYCWRTGRSQIIAHSRVAFPFVKLPSVARGVHGRGVHGRWLSPLPAWGATN